MKNCLFVMFVIITASSAHAAENCWVRPASHSGAIFGTYGSKSKSTVGSLEECVGKAKSMIGTKFESDSFGETSTTHWVDFKYSDDRVQVTGQAK